MNAMSMMNQVGTGKIYLGEHIESTDGRVTVVLQHIDDNDTLIVDTGDIVALRDRLNQLISTHKLE